MSLFNIAPRTQRILLRTAYLLLLAGWVTVVAGVLTDSPNEALVSPAETLTLLTVPLLLPFLAAALLLGLRRVRDPEPRRFMHGIAAIFVCASLPIAVLILLATVRFVFRPALHPYGPDSGLGYVPLFLYVGCVIIPSWLLVTGQTENPPAVSK